MKKYIFILLNLIIFNSASAQNYFGLNVDTTDGWLKKQNFEIVVNSKKYKIDSTYTFIPTEYPQFDTLYLPGSPAPDSIPIICNFSPGNKYSIIEACCQTLDIIPSSKLLNDSMNVWRGSYSAYAHKIINATMDRPFMTFKLENVTNQDTIYGWYVDYSCFPSFKILDSNGWKYGQAVKCFYWNNISQYIFFETIEDYSKMINENGVVNDVYPENYNELGNIFIRLFDSKNYILTYDVLNKIVVLEYDY